LCHKITGWHFNANLFELKAKQSVAGVQRDDIKNINISTILDVIQNSGDTEGSYIIDIIRRGCNMGRLYIEHLRKKASAVQSENFTFSAIYLPR
jgi:hypothetical protein